MATHSSILAWRIPRTEKPVRLQSMGSQSVRHNWSDLAHTYRDMNAQLWLVQSLDPLNSKCIQINLFNKREPVFYIRVQCFRTSQCSTWQISETEMTMSGSQTALSLARNRLCPRKKVRGMIQLALSIATTTSKESKLPFSRHYAGVRDGLASEQGSRTWADPRGGSEHACNLMYHKDVANRKKGTAAHHLSAPPTPLLFALYPQVWEK